MRLKQFHWGSHSLSPCFSKNNRKLSRTISLLLPYRPPAIIRSMASRYSLLSLMVRLSCIFPDIVAHSFMVRPERIMSMQYDSKIY